MLATTKRLRSSSPPSSPLDQVTKRRRQSSFHHGPSAGLEADVGIHQPHGAAAGPSGWRGDVPPPVRPALSPWEHGSSSSSSSADAAHHYRSPTARSTAALPGSYFQQLPPVPSPLSAVHSPPSYFPRLPPASAASLRQATHGPSMHTPRATAGAQHDSHAHHRNAPLFHPAFIDQHPPWSSSSSASSAAIGSAHSRPPDGMGMPGAAFGGHPHQATTPLMGPPSLPRPREDLRRASIGRLADGEHERDAMSEDEGETWDDVEGTVQDNLRSLADSPYAGMNQLLHSLHRPRQPQPHVASSPYPHFSHESTQLHRLHTTPQTPHDHGPDELALQESSATRRRYGDVNRQLGELVLNRRVGRAEVGDGR